MKQKITSLAVALTFLHSQIAYALPVKNNASNGVQFAKNHNTLNITAPDKSVINYDSFNIAANEAVNFVQPGASASVLNRVLSGGASTINGALAANGNVLLVNPSGLMFGGGATVNANSFIASTKNITDANFHAGLLKFEGSTSGTIVNNGLINGSKNVGLIAANIENKGTIKAGKNAGLIAGNTGSVSVDFDGDGLINFTADSSTIGSGTIENSGIIKAGQVLLTANDVSNVLENVINNTGTIEATKAVTGENGAIQLISDASVKNTGNLKAPEGKIIINTGGDMNSEGTISAVDGEVDIEATGDVTSSGTLEAGKLTEKGATFGISGTFSVDESSLKNDDDAIEFTGDTTLTGNISDVDNIIVGGGVTLTLAADVTLTAGADTSSNTNVNDSSNIVPGGGSAGGDFIWMADDAVIDGAGYNLTFDTKGENSWLTSINGVKDLTFLNGNTDKVSNTVTYALKKDITTTGTFTIGEGTSVYLYPIDSVGAAISDIKLTADKFAAGGTGANAGSIKLNDKNLTLDATSAIQDSAVNFYMNDQGNDVVYSTGSLTFLGHTDTKFLLGLANNDRDIYNTIMVKGIDLGSAVRVANIEIPDAIVDLSAAADAGGDFTFHNGGVSDGSSIILSNGFYRFTVTGNTVQMGQGTSVYGNGRAVNFFTATKNGVSNIRNIEGARNIGFNGISYYDYPLDGTAGTGEIYYLHNSLNASGDIEIANQAKVIANAGCSSFTAGDMIYMGDYAQVSADTASLSLTGGRLLFNRGSAIDACNNDLSLSSGVTTQYDLFLRNLQNLNNLTLQGGGNFILHKDITNLNLAGALSIGAAGDATSMTMSVATGIAANKILMDSSASIDMQNQLLDIRVNEASVLSSILNADDLTLRKKDDPWTPVDYTLNNNIVASGALALERGVKLLLGGDTTLDAAYVRFDTAEIDANNYSLTFNADTYSQLGVMSNLNNLILQTGAQYELYDNTLNVNNLTVGDGVKVRGVASVTTINAQNISMGAGSDINAWTTPAVGVYNDIVLNVAIAAAIESITNVNNLTLKGGGTFTMNAGKPYIGADNLFTLGANNDGTVFVLGDANSNIVADSIVMDASASISGLGNSLAIRTNTGGVLYNIDLGVGDLTLEGRDTTPASYDENGIIVCSNNNTPTYINAN